MGVMQEIREHLYKGKSSGDLIGMGYAPGTVYRIQREFRQGNQKTLGFPDLTGHLTFIQDDGDAAVVWHPESPVICPGCLEPVIHWQMCTGCNRFIPEGCGCAPDSPAVSEGFVVRELFETVQI